MGKNILSEVNRTREIMGLPIVEQRKETIITNIPYDVQVPVPTIKGTYLPGKSSPSAFIKESITTIIKAINNTPGASDKLGSGDLQLVDINVKAGASNYWDKTTGPTQFDHEIVGDKYEPTTDGKGPGLSEDGYDLNMELAELRASTYIDEIKPLLGVEEGGLGIVISDKLSETPEGMVVYTGGKNDDTNCTTDCGQVLLLTLSFVYTDEEEYRKTKCLPELMIAIGTMGMEDGHICDEAIFSVKVNGAEIGIANLNNAKYDIVKESDYNFDDRKHYNKLISLPGFGVGIGNSFEDDGNGGQRKSDNKQGGKRTWKTTINTEDADLNWGDENILSITSLVNTKTASRGEAHSYINGTRVCPDSQRNTGRGEGACGSHTEIPWVVIKNTPTTKGEYEMVYGKYPNIGRVNGDMDTTDLLTLDNCGVPVGPVG